MVISVIKLTSLLISALPEGPMVCGCALFVSTFKESVDYIVLFMSCNGFLGIPYSLRRSLNIVHELKAMFVSSYLVFFFVFLLLLSSLRHSWEKRQRGWSGRLEKRKRAYEVLKWSSDEIKKLRKKLERAKIDQRSCRKKNWGNASICNWESIYKHSHWTGKIYQSVVIKSFVKLW